MDNGLSLSLWGNFGFLKILKKKLPPPIVCNKFNSWMDGWRERERVKSDAEINVGIRFLVQGKIAAHHRHAPFPLPFHSFLSLFLLLLLFSFFVCFHPSFVPLIYLLYIHI